MKYNLFFNKIIDLNSTRLKPWPLIFSSLVLTTLVTTSFSNIIKGKDFIILNQSTEYDYLTQVTNFPKMEVQWTVKPSIRKKLVERAHGENPITLQRLDLLIILTARAVWVKRQERHDIRREVVWNKVSEEEEPWVNCLIKIQETVQSF